MRSPAVTLPLNLITLLACAIAAHAQSLPYPVIEHAARAVAGKPFHEFQKERIFDVLSMNQASDSVTFNGSGQPVREPARLRGVGPGAVEWFARPTGDLETHGAVREPG
jgi:CubicO group peptidase (beta-lactamase class C family)